MDNIRQSGLPGNLFAVLSQNLFAILPRLVPALLMRYLLAHLHTWYKKTKTAVYVEKMASGGKNYTFAPKIMVIIS